MILNFIPQVAIKVIDTRKIKDEYVRSNLHREAGIMAKLRHPNIIRLYETLKATTLYCLVTEYCSGGELKSHIKSQENQRLTEKEARPFVRQLVSAIEYLHERGVVHRDLKMENILLDAKKKNVKLIDFGLSNVYREDDPLRTHCGSPEYAAPELFVLGKTYGPEIDIWSLGIIMYAMVLGHLPFSTPYKDEYQRQRMLQNIQKGLSGYHDREMQILTKECRTFVHQLVEPNPELRISLTDIVRHPWVTRHGRLPFCSYLPPAKDKTIRHQVIVPCMLLSSAAHSAACLRRCWSRDVCVLPCACSCA
ncbi:hypothetical protein CAPTEDRAFT_128601 [Capitella teleta]|uniref:non-specific serine/threonine protein kinase n=1 Tax=Capitella teleta TaxID=283909 RepID=R7TX05_CAPTE|nr:hypothetical protein CAPTEDRAFT_128601 [Capitella teleta]|eukprot:ELT98137.1 hypothetical protein CAPTEDRAFT_128601 [Capitella teleta]